MSSTVPSLQDNTDFYTSTVWMESSSKLDLENEHRLSVNYIIYIAIEALLMVIICFGNSLVIIIIWKSPQLHNFTNYFIAQLAIADLAVGLCLPFNMVLFVHEQIMSNAYICGLLYATSMTPTAASIVCLLLMTLER